MNHTHLIKIFVLPAGFRWIDITDPDPNRLEELTQEFKLDSFQVKDSLLPGHLPKIETGGEYLFLILRAFTGQPGLRSNDVRALTNKMAFFMNGQCLITIHRTSFDFLENIPLQHSHPFLLMMAIVRRVLHTYEAPLGELEALLDKAEEQLFLRRLNTLSLEELYYQKSRSRVLRKLLQITQSVLQEIPSERRFATALQDARDRALSLVVGFDGILDDLNSLLNTYLSLNTQHTNEVIKLLTVFSAFFLPLTFIAGIYGMNFDVMPELRWPWGYYFALGLMALVALVVYVWFRRRRIL
ncbi:MAG: hypothetical protein N2110_02325 [Flavobacteriales bacterium]|nr:hypothetical protein [Flavobacteriales bacterium]MCX7767846.1 hypothetical protein [Flavobacteriales bacterium]MDW8410656.1 CorA family divalent cation transporter [Flavobacteriales bacterium]